MPIEEHMEHYLAQGMDKKEAMKAVAKDRGIIEKGRVSGIAVTGSPAV